MLIKGVVTQEIISGAKDWKDIPRCISEMLDGFHDDIHQKTLSISFKVTKGKDVPYPEGKAGDYMRKRNIKTL
tara:strand:- start:135 stop:353 length:219 start_codon:yes stop_codon:yes gene_type:complete